MHSTVEIQKFEWIWNFKLRELKVKAETVDWLMSIGGHFLNNFFFDPAFSISSEWFFQFLFLIEINYY